PSETYPNAMLVERALASLRDGDIVMAHLGIWSRKDPFAPMFEPLIAGLKARGFCFATLGRP
ncbi:MAG: peptidase A8, partial [Proteobacteria bacterium]|nr:peptidase A8 [Pseudomonadota bacterium]